MGELIWLASDDWDDFDHEEEHIEFEAEVSEHRRDGDDEDLFDDDDPLMMPGPATEKSPDREPAAALDSPAPVPSAANDLDEDAALRPALAPPAKPRTKARTTAPPPPRIAPELPPLPVAAEPVKAEMLTPGVSPANRRKGPRKTAPVATKSPAKKLPATPAKAVAKPAGKKAVLQTAATALHRKAVAPSAKKASGKAITKAAAGSKRTATPLTVKKAGPARKKAPAKTVSPKKAAPAPQKAPAPKKPGQKATKKVPPAKSSPKRAAKKSSGPARKGGRR